MNMQHNVPELLRKMMEVGKVKQTGLAKRLSIPKRLKIEQPQISRWMKGQTPEGQNYERIVTVAHEMGVLSDMRSEDVAATLPERQFQTVKLKGYVGASGEAFYYRLADEDLEEVLAPDNATDQTVAVEVRGKSLGPALESWLVFYADVRSPITPDMLNQLCVVGLADDRLLVKKLERKDGQLVLVSNNGEPDIVAPQIEWAAKVTSMRPR